MKLAVMDYASAQIKIYSVKKNMTEEEIDDFIEEQGFRTKDVYFMYAKKIDVSEE